MAAGCRGGDGPSWFQSAVPCCSPMVPCTCMLSLSLEPQSQSGLPMPLKRIRSLQLRWLHFLQPDIIPSMFSSCSLAATSSMGEAIEMMNFVDMRHEEGTGAGHNWVEVRLFLRVRVTKHLIALSGWHSQPHLVRPLWRVDLGIVRSGSLAVH